MQVDFNALRYQGNICISGLTASGKTTHSHLLAGEFGLTYVSGSQIQLNFMGVSPIQTKDFWISERSKSFWDPDQFVRIDSELLRLEKSASGHVFDTSTMPWRHTCPCLAIWLESDLDSRVKKSLISHRGRGSYPLSEYPTRILEKDNATVTLYKTLYGIDIGSDLACFDLIVDISSLVEEATLDHSLRSIAIAHSIIRPAVAFYLTGRPDFRHALENASKQHAQLIRRNTLLDH